MADYVVTDKGFVIKRLDTIMEEIHSELTEAFGFDTRLTKPSFLDTLITTFSYQIADLWETAQNSYYSKYPTTATDLNLDNAVQYGGIRRAAAKQSLYRLHCTGDDGTEVGEGTIVATNTTPKIRLFASEDFTIDRKAFNKVKIKVAAVEIGPYSVTINGTQYVFTTTSEGDDILAGLAALITDTNYTVAVSGEELVIEDNTKSRSNILTLSDNLTTSSVTTIAAFLTEDYGTITIPNGLVTEMESNVTGFEAVTNILDPTYGRQTETDIELRQSYIAKSALRSNTMVESIVGELLENVDDVVSAVGYENDTDETDENGLLPHSVEIIVEGGDENAIGLAILRRKAGGIGTNGSVTVDVEGLYGDHIPVRFNRPQYLYAWLKVELTGDASRIPSDYAKLTIDSIINDTLTLSAGEDLLTQTLHNGIYENVAGVTHIDIYTATETSESDTPSAGDYSDSNIEAEMRQRILVGDARIEVTLNGNNS